MLIEAFTAITLQSSTIETWQCLVSPRRADWEPYEATYVVTGDRVIETALNLSSAWEILESNDRRLTIAASQFGVDDYTGAEITQVATVIVLDRRSERLKRIFIQDGGAHIETVEGSCARSVL